MTLERTILRQHKGIIQIIEYNRTTEFYLFFPPLQIIYSTKQLFQASPNHHHMTLWLSADIP